MTPTVIPNRVRVLFYMQRHESLSFEQFSDYWRGPHPPLFLKTKAVKENLLAYEQVSFSILNIFKSVEPYVLFVQWHVNQEWRKRLLDAGQTVPDWDGIVVVEAETVEKALAVSFDRVLPESEGTY